MAYCNNCTLSILWEEEEHEGSAWLPAKTKTTEHEEQPVHMLDYQARESDSEEEVNSEDEWTNHTHIFSNPQHNKHS
jgi:hypothetical protein